jgi:hypothetical protein
VSEFVLIVCIELLPPDRGEPVGNVLHEGPFDAGGCFMAPRSGISPASTLVLPL